MVEGVKGVDRAVLICRSMGASRRSVKKRQAISQSLAVHPCILSAPRGRVGRIDRSIECGLHVIMSQAKILLRRRTPRMADDHRPPASPWRKETRRSGLFVMKSSRKRRCKESPRSFTPPLHEVASGEPTIKPLIGRSISHLAGPERTGSAADRSESLAEDGAFADSQRCNLAGQGLLDVIPGRQRTGLSAFSETCVAYWARSYSMFFNVRWPTASTRAAVTVKTASPFWW